MVDPLPDNSIVYASIAMVEAFRIIANDNTDFVTMSPVVNIMNDDGTVAATQTALVSNSIGNLPFIFVPQTLTVAGSTVLLNNILNNNTYAFVFPLQGYDRTPLRSASDYTSLTPEDFSTRAQSGNASYIINPRKEDTVYSLIIAATVTILFFIALIAIISSLSKRK